MRIDLIVAVDKNNGISKNNSIPWHISEDMKFFKETTLFSPLVVSRTTWQRDLKEEGLWGRYLYIITRTEENFKKCKIDKSKGIIIQVNSITKEILESMYELQPFKSSNIIIIGGAELYKATLNLVDRIYLTRINKDYQCDKFFPPIPSYLKLQTSTPKENLTFEIYAKN